jgi:hypothetical protein
MHRTLIGIMRVIFDHLRPSGRIMPVMKVIEAQSARSWGLTITSITNRSGRLRHARKIVANQIDLICALQLTIAERPLAAPNGGSGASANPRHGH